MHKTWQKLDKLRQSRTKKVQEKCLYLHGGEPWTTIGERQTTCGTRHWPTDHPFDEHGCINSAFHLVVLDLQGVFVIAIYTLNQEQQSTMIVNKFQAQRLNTSLLGTPITQDN